MPTHINLTMVLIALAITFPFRFVALLVFLIIMIKIQKFDFAWLPLLGATLLATVLDTIPLVGHFLAVPVLYFCIWKITNSSLYPDAAFTVGLSYALVRCVAYILLAYAPMPNGIHPKPQKYDLASLAPSPGLQATNEVAEADPAPQPQAPVVNVPDNKTTANISVKGVSRDASGAMVTIQCNSKVYTISSDEGTPVSTDNGIVTVRVLAADDKNVTLDVGGQPVKYALK